MLGTAQGNAVFSKLSPDRFIRHANTRLLG